LRPYSQRSSAAAGTPDCRLLNCGDSAPVATAVCMSRADELRTITRFLEIVPRTRQSAKTSLDLLGSRLFSNVTDLAAKPTHRRTPAPIVLSDYRLRSDVGHLIELCRNSLGLPLGVWARGLLIDVCTTPPHDTSWDEAHGVIIAPDLSLWEAVLTYTDYDVTASPHYVARVLPDGSIRMERTRWSAVPTSEQVVATLRALHGTSAGAS
jgi:hypothetical protein